MSPVYPDSLTTAILLPMPPAVQRVALPLIQRYNAPVLQFVPAHLTLLTPFVPLDELDAASVKLRALAAEIAPFEFDLAGYGHFPDGAYLQPLRTEGLQRLFAAIFTAFPDYPPYGGEWGTDFLPHVSVALNLSPEAEAALQLPDYAPLTVPVDRFHLMYGSFEVPVPFITHDVIHLGRA